MDARGTAVGLVDAKLRLGFGVLTAAADVTAAVAAAWVVVAATAAGVVVVVTAAAGVVVAALGRTFANATVERPARASARRIGD
jgi:hypothetical protein